MTNEVQIITCEFINERIDGSKHRIASHAIDTISRWKYGHFLNRWKCNYALYPWTAFRNESHANVIQMNPFQVISENTKFLWIWILIDDMYDA